MLDTLTFLIAGGITLFALFVLPWAFAAFTVEEASNEAGPIAGLLAAGVIIAGVVAMWKAKEHYPQYCNIGSLLVIALGGLYGIYLKIRDDKFIRELHLMDLDFPESQMARELITAALPSGSILVCVEEEALINTPITGDDYQPDLSQLQPLQRENLRRCWIKQNDEWLEYPIKEFLTYQKQPGNAWREYAIHRWSEDRYNYVARAVWMDATLTANGRTGQSGGTIVLTGLYKRTGNEWKTHWTEAPERATVWEQSPDFR